MPSQGVFHNATRDKARNPLVIFVPSRLENSSPEEVDKPLAFDAINPLECDAELCKQGLLKQAPIVLDLTVEIGMPSEGVASQRCCDQLENPPLIVVLAFGKRFRSDGMNEIFGISAVATVEQRDCERLSDNCGCGISGNIPVT